MSDGRLTSDPGFGEPSVTAEPAQHIRLEINEERVKAEPIYDIQDLDEGEDALRMIRALVIELQQQGVAQGDLESILNQELRLRAYISGLRAR